MQTRGEKSWGEKHEFTQVKHIFSQIYAFDPRRPLRAKKHLQSGPICMSGGVGDVKQPRWYLHNSQRRRRRRLCRRTDPLKARRSTYRNAAPHSELYLTPWQTIHRHPNSAKAEIPWFYSSFFFQKKFDTGPKKKTPIPRLWEYVKHLFFTLQLTGAPAGGEQPRLQGISAFYSWANCTAELLWDSLCIIEMDCGIDY